MNFEQYKNYKKILVTGPQRSGTTICAKILAAELNYTYVDERKVGVRSLTELFNKLSNESNIVIQGPAFCSCCQWIDSPETAIIIMRRDVNDIKKSQLRISWEENNNELKNYFKTSGDIAEVRYHYWDEFQSKMMRVPYFEIEYESLKSHPMWVDPEQRKNFTRRQTSLEEIP